MAEGVISLCLGIDISPRRLGWALARLEDGAPVACGMESIELPANGWDRQRVFDALTVAGTEAWKAVGAREVHYVAIERPALPPKSGTNGAFNAGRAYQEAISAVRRRWPWAVVDEMQPSEFRRLIGLPGNASKDELATFAHGFGFRQSEKPMQDAWDAACIAVAGVRRNAETLAVPAGEAGR